MQKLKENIHIQLQTSVGSSDSWQLLFLLSSTFVLTCHPYPNQSVTFRYREFPVPGIFHIFGGIGTGIEKNWYRKKSRNRYRKNLVPEKSLGTSIGKIWYRKKVSEPVSEKFVTEKSTSISIKKIWYRKKVSVSVNILGTVTLWVYP